MIIVRQARYEDIEGVLKLVREFQKEGLDEFKLYSDEAKTKLVIRSNIEHSLVMEKDGEIIGCLGGQITTSIASTDKVWEELLWFVTQKYRLHGVKLLKELERKCREWGIKQVLMVHLGNLNADKMKRFYKKRDYKFLEAHYIKTLEME